MQYENLDFENTMLTIYIVKSKHNKINFIIKYQRLTKLFDDESVSNNLKKKLKAPGFQIK